MSQKKILVVNEDPHLVDKVKTHLISHGFEILTAVDGHEALIRARKEKPDLVILDVMTAKVDGFKVCRMLKFDEKYSHMPVILLSSPLQEIDKDLGFQVGADAYIIKPFDMQVLLPKIQELLSAK